MKLFSILFLGLAAVTAFAAEPRALFDGKTLDGWETPDKDLWRVEGGAIVGGDGKTKIAHNSFLSTVDSFGDFEFRCLFRMTGDPATGMINSGIQFRSERLKNGHMRGFQADIGDPSWWGGLYDEHRRGQLAAADMKKIDKVLKRNDWNEYVIRAEGPRIRTYINGVLGIEFVDKDVKIPRDGKIAVQVHSGGAAKVEFKEITIREIPRLEYPLTPAQQQATFRVPEGFVVELVASEETGLPKPITVTFDDSGRMWSMTATEYPVDANENADEARALWAKGGKDRVVIFDQPTAPGPHTPRPFIEGLAMPMGVLPWADGAIVGHGPEIRRYHDRDGDGKADAEFEVIVSGFGIQDSHLLPHQFTLMPDGGIAMAQGAFNKGKPQAAGGGDPVSFDFCKLGVFDPGGANFRVVGYGLNNIWGLVLGREGEMFVQEANDMKFSVTPFQEGTSYPGIGNQKFKPYAPVAPPVADYMLGGTGLSGLALADFRSGGYPDPWNGVTFVANPITRTINAVRIGRSDDGFYRAERVEDFLTCADEAFRPIAITFGPDGCLYITDWYNKIISHNEVPGSTRIGTRPAGGSGAYATTANRRAPRSPTSRPLRTRPSPGISPATTPGRCGPPGARSPSANRRPWPSRCGRW